MNVMNLDTLSWTTLTEYPLQEHWHLFTRHTDIATTDLVLETTGKTEKEETGPDLSLDTTDIIAQLLWGTCTEATPNHNNGTSTATTEATQDKPIKHTKNTATGPAMTTHTSHTVNPLHTAAHQAATLRIARDHIHNHATDHQSIVHIKKDHTVWIILQPEKPKVPPKEE